MDCKRQTADVWFEWYRPREPQILESGGPGKPPMLGYQMLKCLENQAPFLVQCWWFQDKMCGTVIDTSHYSLSAKSRTVKLQEKWSHKKKSLERCLVMEKQEPA